MTTQFIRKHATAAGILPVLCAIIFLYFAQSQETDQTQPEDRQPTIADRAPKGYRVPERPPVITPFTNVSAENLRLVNIWLLPESVQEDVVMNPKSRWRISFDGQWVVFNNPEEGLHIVKTDGSNEKRVLRSGRSNPGRVVEKIIWSWNSKRIFYQIRQYLKDVQSTKHWFESVDIEAGEIIKHPELGYNDSLYSLSIARYPDDPIIHYDHDNGIVSASTKDGTKRWLIVHGGLSSVSPDGQKVLVGVRGQGVAVYAVDGSGPLADLGRGPYHDEEWSSDSTKLVYSIREIDQSDGAGRTLASEIYMIDINGTGRKQLTNTPDIIEGHPYWLHDGTGTGFVAGTREDESYFPSYIADLTIE